MTNLPTIFFDCQTNGSSAKTSQIIEAAWIFCPNGLVGPSQSECYFIKLLPNETLPSRIAKMTGIDEEDLQTGISEKKLYLKLMEILKKNSQKLRWVFHYEQFEKAFLLQLFSKYSKKQYTALPGVSHCTLKLAKTHFENLPSYSIHAVSGYLGQGIEKLKRSSDHALATKYIWDQIHSNGPLKEVRQNPIDPKRKNYIHLMDKKIRLTWPKSPGIYKMHSKNNQLLYIGKAKNLNSRLNSYFRGQKTKGGRLNELLTQVAEIKFIEADSAVEAAILESIYIDKLKPKYNIALTSEGKDPLPLTTKQFPFLSLDKNTKKMTLESSSLSTLSSLYHSVDEDLFLFESFSRRSISKQMSILAKEVLNQTRLPQNYHTRISRLFGGYWSIVQQYDVREFATGDIDWDDLFEKDPDSYLKEFLHNLFLKSAIEFQKSKWLERLLESKFEFKFKSNLKLRLNISLSKNLISIQSSRHLKNYSLCDSSESALLNRAVYNKINVLLSEIKKHVKSGGAIEMVLPSEMPFSEHELSDWMLNL